MPKRSRQEDVESFHRTNRSAKARRFHEKHVPRTRGKSAVGALPRNRIGRNNGLIVSNQKVPRPKAGSVQYRRSVYGAVTSADKCWLGGSTIGTSSTHFKTIAHAILAHYLRRMGDFRASNDEAANDVPVFGSFLVKYGKDAPNPSMQGDDFQEGDVIDNDTYTTMADNLGAQLRSQARYGYFPVTIAFSHPIDPFGNNSTALIDTNMGRHKITVSCAGRFRFQNVTPAGDGSTDASTNINAVDANPVNGKVYTFRNQAPLFSTNYVASITDGTTLDGIEDLQDVHQSFDMYGNTVVAADGKGGDAFLHLAAPPLNPRSIWRNVNTTGNVTFPPGGFKTFTTSYLRSESIFKYCQKISQAEASTTGENAYHATYPPAGDSFMMCLRPTIKTSAGELIKMSYDTEHIMKAMITKFKPAALQVVNVIEP